jgi:hypothetical protein
MVCLQLATGHSEAGADHQDPDENWPHSTRRFHANWRCNAIYLRKVEEAGLKPDLKAGDSAVPDTEKYLDSVAQSLRDLAKLIANEVSSKHGI